ncbi:anhydro-N-acetylmuramic acid kinase [Pleurocapsa sp. CCALA 161]|uniref:anhydro-N-acetylmuramic acid kinase n=1 Tax=Pleurocapsa sp. CCALA 161 TaxID=2107688 RepID=UPI000D06E4ED|nr:anhydro-N-acetylmuramic acid kinase [Pleurocapsa sp. CCALA 161]PSB11856.1 anhydro-N-acetylmuramic acid kinase [Pleurocapsa sp. CCALA 161]
MIVIGLMSGTSVDGIDAALVKIKGTEQDLEVKVLAEITFAYPEELRERILAICGGESLNIAELAELDDAIAIEFANAAQQIQAQHQTADLIGSHGQTIYHRPPLKDQLGYSYQVGRGEVIAYLTGIQTISNFRAADIAAGGEGAPLVSKIDLCLLSHPTKTRAIQNLGGIGNVTYLPPKSTANWDTQIFGWDTGPANALLDLAVARLTNGTKTYDQNGQWAAQGKPNQELVAQWLQQDFFQQSPPKSTGRELFSQDYLEQCWQEMDEQDLGPSDRLATLTELTVASIVHSYRQFLPQMPDEVLLCGGGSRNLYLRQRLQAELISAQIGTTDEVGIDGNFKEAIAFAVLAYWRVKSIPGNLPQVTGAVKPVLLGDVHPSIHVCK